jgi:prophage tail gpP-like protein
VTVGLVPEGPKLDVVGVEVEGKRFEEWKDYDISSNLFTPEDRFSMRCGPIPNSIQKLILPGRRIRIYFSDGKPSGEVTVFKGWIEGFRDKGKKGEEVTDISGRDEARMLIENEVPPGTVVKGKSFYDIAVQLCSPFGISVMCTNEANRLAVADKARFKKLMAEYQQDVLVYNDTYKKLAAVHDETWTDAEARAEMASIGMPKPLRPPTVNGIFKTINDAEPQDGETIWQFLVRYVERLEVHMWMSAEGRLVLQRPNYDQDPLYVFIDDKKDPSRNNVLDRDYGLNISGMPTQITRTGRSKGQGEKKERLQSIVESTKLVPSAEALEMPSTMLQVSEDFKAEKWILDTEARNQAELDKRNQYGMKAAETGFFSLTVVARGHDQGGRMFVPDTIARYKRDVLGIDGLFHISDCQYHTDEKGEYQEGPLTTMRLNLLHSWAPATT